MPDTSAGGQVSDILHRAAGLKWFEFLEKKPNSYPKVIFGRVRLEPVKKQIQKQIILVFISLKLDCIIRYKVHDFNSKVSKFSLLLTLALMLYPDNV